MSDLSSKRKQSANSPVSRFFLFEEMKRVESGEASLSFAFQEQKATYAAALQLQQHVIGSLKQGETFAAIYLRAVEHLQNNHPKLVPHLVKHVGHATGALYRDPALVFNQKNEKFVLSFR